jgi:uncharacterized protein
MTEAVAAARPVPAPDSPPIIAAEPAPLQPVEAAYRRVMRIRLALLLLVPVIGLCLADWRLMPQIGGPWGLLTVLTLLLAVIAVVTIPARRYARLGYAVGGDALRVVHGYLFHVDTIVPFVRVQHIDVGAGPVERSAGLAHLVVHTAGTHNSIVTVPGLRADDAAAMRDAIRAHVVTDFA